MLRRDSVKYVEHLSAPPTGNVHLTTRMDSVASTDFSFSSDGVLAESKPYSNREHNSANSTSTVAEESTSARCAGVFVCCEGFAIAMSTFVTYYTIGAPCSFVSGFLKDRGRSGDEIGTLGEASPQTLTSF